ncbi:energy transducer TonB [Emcibacter nanhaiensis]|uniref:Protein TonB n=1 Tax=Emcibacter nanhaiensis TaxID=1505037 RepID=A0A501PPF6_9PROT|nr:energy transducer TonB [Emcibacter nanhaiensis]TPD61676.1 energy transducer TonB [Emcibacter nanhaiensis]
MIARTGTSFSLAALVTFGLFFFMQQMVAAPEIRLAPERDPIPVVIGTVRDIRDIDNTPKMPDRPEPVDVVFEDTLPPEPTPGTGISLNPDPIGGSAPTGLPGKNAVGFSDGEVYAITAIAPEYPAAAARKGLSGYVVVGFTVDKTGAVSDAYVIESSSGLFDRSALRAIRKFKYKPKVVNGTPVAQGNLMYKFTFELQDDA